MGRLHVPETRSDASVAKVGFRESGEDRWCSGPGRFGLLPRMSLHAERAEAFRALHERRGIFAIPNPWDAGSARLLAQMGFEALATTSAGFAYSIGRPDGEGALSRAETLVNARAIVEATPLPVSADLENGFGDEPEDCAETIRQAAAAGLAGGSIEDATGRAEDRIYAFDFAVARVRAAV